MKKNISLKTYSFYGFLEFGIKIFYEDIFIQLETLSLSFSTRRVDMFLSLTEAIFKFDVQGFWSRDLRFRHFQHAHNFLLLSVPVARPFYYIDSVLTVYIWSCKMFLRIEIFLFKYCVFICSIYIYNEKTNIKLIFI